MEQESFIAGVEKMRGDLLRQAMHYLDNLDDAEDAVQDTLVKLWMLRDRIADLNKMRNLSSVVCKNVSLNMLRDKKEQVQVDENLSLTTAGNPQKELEEKENHERLIQGIAALTEKQRTLIRMRNVENLSYVEIAHVLGTTESSVRGMISKTRAQLMAQMKGE